MIPDCWSGVFVFTDAELSVLLNVHPKTLVKWRSAGRRDLLPVWFKRGRDVCYRRDDVEEFLVSLGR